MNDLCIIIHTLNRQTKIFWKFQCAHIYWIDHCQWKQILFWTSTPLKWLILWMWHAFKLLWNILLLYQSFNIWLNFESLFILHLHNAVLTLISHFWFFHKFFFSIISVLWFVRNSFHEVKKKGHVGWLPFK